MKAILFVDDHEALARLSCRILQEHGYRADYAYDGIGALTKFQRGKFDMVVTDYRMEGMSGVELARLLRQEAPELPIIIVSGYAPEPCEAVSAWVEKQDLFPGLLDKIKELLSAAGESAA